MNCVVAKNPIDAMLFGVEQGFVKALGNPGMALEKLLAQHHDMHDRKYSGAAKMIGLDRARIGEQPALDWYTGVMEQWSDDFSE